jgi:NSS family neurotransmitter:Na+ symporter
LAERERWVTRWGLILAMAGNAIGLGNFLRFPVQATQNGGGAFMIPYFIALFFLAVPLMWCEWAMGRYGGRHGHGTTPGIFALLWRHPIAKYLGVLGVFLPIGVVIYYTYIESWTLAYGAFSLFGQYDGVTTRDGMSEFLASYQGLNHTFFPGVFVAYFFFILTMGVNWWILGQGVAKGIERLALVAVPVLFLFAIVLVIRIFTLGAPDPTHPDQQVLNGLGFIWNPDFSRLGDAKVWLAAAGQIFFTTGVGWGAIQVYASYMKERSDVVVTGLSTVMTNEVAEVILGGSIAIPIAFAFFGTTATLHIAHSGAFNLGFASMPVIFQFLPMGHVLGMCWFVLLFLAAVTSSVALMQPLIAFLQDELRVSRRRAVGITVATVFLAAQVPIFGLKGGALDEMDFWCGTFGVAFFALIECILFVWLFSPEKAWSEIHQGAQVKLPRLFLFVLKYVTPVYLGVLFIAWAWQQGPAVLSMEGAAPEDVPWRWAARLLMLGLIGALCLFTAVAWRRIDRTLPPHYTMVEKP